MGNITTKSNRHRLMSDSRSEPPAAAPAPAPDLTWKAWYQSLKKDGFLDASIQAKYSEGVKAIIKQIQEHKKVNKTVNSALVIATISETATSESILDGSADVLKAGAGYNRLALDPFVRYLQRLAETSTPAASRSLR
jgi:hypothetical protein